MKPVTMQDIAQRAGMSRASVWMALRNHPRVSEKTRLRIQELASSMGYQSNPLVAAHMSNVRRGRVGGSTATIAYVTTIDDARLLYQPFLLDHIKAMEACATRLGYGFELFTVDNDKNSPDRVEQKLRSRGIFGIVFGLWEAPLPELNWRWDNFACVRYDEFTHLPAFHLVRMSEPGLLEKAWNHAQKQGYRRIGLVIDSITDAILGYRPRSMFLGLQSLLPEIQRVPLMLPATGDQWSPEALFAWIRDARPDCLLVRNPEVYDWLRDGGYRIPQDIGFVGMKGPHHESVPQVGPDLEQNASVVINLLDGMLRNNERGLPKNRATIVTDAILIEPRKTMARKPRKKQRSTHAQQA